MAVGTVLYIAESSEGKIHDHRFGTSRVTADWCGVDINYGRVDVRVTRHDELVQPERLGALKVLHGPQILGSLSGLGKMRFPAESDLPTQTFRRA